MRCPSLHVDLRGARAAELGTALADLDSEILDLPASPEVLLLDLPAETPKARRRLSRLAGRFPAPTTLMVLLDSQLLADLLGDAPWHDRLVGLGWPAPAAQAKTVEIVVSSTTERLAVAHARSLVVATGRHPLRSADRPGRILARLRACEVDHEVDPERAVRCAGQLLDEGICSRQDLEFAAKAELGWPAGPLEMAAGERLSAWIGTWRERRLHVPFHLARLATTGSRSGAADIVQTEDAERITLTLDRPQWLNALDPSLLANLEEEVDAALERADGRSIRLSGNGRAFLAGVDTRWILSRLESEDLDGILEFVRRGQALFRRLSEAKSRVLVELRGFVAGAGVELLGWVDEVGATRACRLRMPETSLGISPALGGTVRLSERMGPALARWMLLTAEPLRAWQARAVGLVDRLIDTESDPDEDAPDFDSVHALDVERALFDRAHSLEELLAGEADFEAWIRERFDFGAAERARALRAQRRLRARAPLALRKTDELLLAARGRSLTQALIAEVEALTSIFESPETLRRIRAAAEARAWTHRLDP